VGDEHPRVNHYIKLVLLDLIHVALKNILLHQAHQLARLYRTTLRLHLAINILLSLI
jgi:hypothetical protein